MRCLFCGRTFSFLQSPRAPPGHFQGRCTPVRLHLILRRKEGSSTLFRPEVAKRERKPLHCLLYNYGVFFFRLLKKSSVPRSAGERAAAATNRTDISCLPARRRYILLRGLCRRSRKGSATELVPLESSGTVRQLKRGGQAPHIVAFPAGRGSSCSEPVPSFQLATFGRSA